MNITRGQDLLDQIYRASLRKHNPFGIHKPSMWLLDIKFDLETLRELSESHFHNQIVSTRSICAFIYHRTNHG